MAGSKIQVKKYIHFTKYFTFTSYKEENKIPYLTKNKNTKKPPKQNSNEKNNNRKRCIYVQYFFKIICILDRKLSRCTFLQNNVSFVILLNILNFLYRL